MDGDMAGSGDADFYIAASDTENRDLDLISDNQALILLSSKNQHPCRYLQGARGPALREICLFSLGFRPFLNAAIEQWMFYGILAFVHYDLLATAALFVNDNRSHEI